MSVLRLLSAIFVTSALIAGVGAQEARPQSATTKPSPASKPTATASAPATPWYEAEIRAFEKADQASPPAPGQVLFVGSSSIRMWSSLAKDMHPMPVLNRGFGGSKTREVLAVFDRIVTPNQPSAIVYYCGDNDLGTDNTDSRAAADGFIEFDSRVRAKWPELPVFYVSIKPSLARWKNWPAMARANELVRAYCQRTLGATYLDLATPTLTAEGKPDPTIFREDGLHLNDKGYAIWTRIIQPAVLEAWQHRNDSSTKSGE